MGTPLGQPAQPGHPSIKLRQPGQYVDFHIVDIAEVPRYEFGTKQPKLNQQGQPQMQHKVTVLVVGGTGQIPDATGPDGAERVVRPGDVATVYVGGREKWDPDLDKTRQPTEFRSWGGAVDTLPDKQLCCGDFARWTYEGDIQGQGAQPRKVRTFRLRRPRPDDGDAPQRCEQLRQEANRTPIGAPAGGGQPYAGGADEPF